MGHQVEPWAEVAHRYCMNDVVLFPVEYGDAEKLQRQLQSYRTTREEALVPIHSRHTLKKYVSPASPIPIVVKGFSGFIVRNDMDAELQELNEFGYHIEFILTNPSTQSPFEETPLGGQNVEER